MTITKVQILNRGDCCEKRLDGAKVFIGSTLCGTISGAPAGKWVDVDCKASGEFLKIQALPNTHLNFCGLKIWQYSGHETIEEEVVSEPEPSEPLATSSGTTVIPEPVAAQEDWITMSSTGKWRGAENKAWNPIAYSTFNPSWQAKQLTCFCTKADEEGPWW